MSIMDHFRNRNVPRLTGPEDLDEQLRIELADRLRPSVGRALAEYAPQPDYSIERVESVLSRHLEELTIARATLAVEADAAQAHLDEIKHKQTVIKIAHDTFAETLAKLTGRVAALDAPKQELTEDLPS